MKSVRTATAVAVAGTVLATGSIALAAQGTAAQGGPIKVFINQTSETKGSVTVTGAIGDYGLALSTDPNGKVDANGSFESLHLKHGTILVDGSKLTKKFAHLKPLFNTTNCSFSAEVSGPTTIASGTGAYLGATGNVKITLIFAGIGARTKSGACSMSNNAPSYGNYNTIIGSGTIRFK